MSAPSGPAAAVGNAPAPAASATSSSGLTFKLHPLVIVNVSDHYTRVKAQVACSGDGSSSSGATAGQPPRVFGCVIGVQRGRTVEIFNSFEIVLDPVTGTLDRSFLEKKQELCRLMLEPRDFCFGSLVTPPWNATMVLLGV
jgi:COP9 signalosome complex subunit 6